MSVSAIIVTRGDVELDPIVESLPDEWEVIVWDNSGAGSTPLTSRALRILAETDLSVYGRYAAIEYASHDLIYVQDDDCIVSDPQAIIDRWRQACSVASQKLLYVDHIDEIASGLHLVANMPQEFRPHYPDSCLVGFGACFHRDLPERAFRSLRLSMDLGYDEMLIYDHALFARTADVVFTTLTPRVLVDVPVEVLAYAHDSNRMWKQPDHFGERTRVLEMARKVRDA